MAPESASRSNPLPGPSNLSTPTPACNLGANPFPEVTDLFCRLPLPTSGPVVTVSRIVTALPLHFPAARLRNVHAFPFGKPVKTTEVVAISFEASNYTLP